ncbi:MAG: SulP family inorganic anion transporter [Sphaerochaeta sp.]|jgi:SulP family sulfate permease|uniref:SulP family inorganic anion transporter n=1 Tax=Sphaerochaeta sp. TaxID=1972642 RepID=UPI003D0EC635
MGCTNRPVKASFLCDVRREFDHYSPAKFSKDLLAGLTVTAVALPLALAFGVSSGMDAASGLITAILAGIIISALGGASYQISGPTGAMAAILITLVAKHGTQGVFIAGFLSGLILLAAALLKVGALVSYIPSPVVTGFTSGIAIIIALGQIDNFFGTVSHGESALAKLASYGELGFPVDLHALLYGALVVALMILWPKKWNARFPASLLGIIVTLVLQMVFEFPVDEVGEIPRSLFGENRLQLTHLPWSQLGEFVSPAISIAALGMVESLLCGSSAGKMKGEKLNATQELYAQGVGNVIIPFFGGIPATAAIARTSVAIKSGQQTRLTGIIHAVGLLASMFLLSPFMSRIPLAALAGVLMMTAWRMNEWHAIKQIFSKRIKTSIAQFVITMAATVVFDLTVAIMTGILFSMVMFIIRSHKISIEVDPVSPELGQYDKTTKVVYVDGSLFFGSQDQLTKTVESLFTEQVQRIIFSLRGVPNIDHSSINEFAEIVRMCRKHSVQVYFCGLQPPVMSMMNRLDFPQFVGQDKFFSSAVTALESLR